MRLFGKLANWQRLEYVCLGGWVCTNEKKKLNFRLTIICSSKRNCCKLKKNWIQLALLLVCVRFVRMVFCHSPYFCFVLIFSFSFSTQTICMLHALYLVLGLGRLQVSIYTTIAVAYMSKYICIWILWCLVSLSAPVLSWIGDWCGLRECWHWCVLIQFE